MTTCILTYLLRFGGICYIHLQGRVPPYKTTIYICTAENLSHIRLRVVLLVHNAWKVYGDGGKAPHTFLTSVLNRTEW